MRPRRNGKCSIAVLHRPIVALALLLLGSGASSGSPDYAAERKALVREIERKVVATRSELGTDRLDPKVIAAIGAVPRHELVPPALRGEAYADHPLPIGAGQTISQPYIVAVMTHLLRVESGDKVYELGTGSGYQAAVLAEMGVHVFSVEIVPELAARAQDNLRRLGYENVKVRVGDGYLGWPEAAPFAGILITAAIDHVPQPLIDQLAPNGRLVMPMGPAGWSQELVVMEKTEAGKLKRKDVLPVRFVPVTGPSVKP
jgi:protein-L-isoaspartate(D-aspartate) O-methyltransferase